MHFILIALFLVSFGNNKFTLMQVFISALIDVAGHARKLDAAFELLQEAKNHGINSGIVSYSSLMGACSNVSPVRQSCFEN